MFHITPRDGIERNGGSYFIPMSIIDALNNAGGRNIKDYQEVPEINYIINLKARMFSNVNIRIESKTTGAEVTNNESLVRVLRNPNWFQSQKEFLRQLSIYRSVTGEEFIYFLTPVGMANTYKGMFCLPPDNIEVKYKGDDFYFTESNPDIEYWYKKPNSGHKIQLDKQNIIHLTDNNIGGKDVLRGKSNLEALRPAIDNIRRAYNKRGIILDMPIGGFTSNREDDTGRIPLTQGEKQTAREDLMNHKGRPIVGSIPLSYFKMDFNAKAMGLFEEVQEDTMRVCDAFGIPFEILSAAKGNTYENKSKAERQAYQNTIIPDWHERQYAINHTLETEGKSWHLVGDYDHLPVFQEDRNEKAQALNTMVSALTNAYEIGAITLNQYQEQLKQFGI